ncbi:MAG: HAD family hydrolase, partial [Oscillospiraceae bacterium]|nr:HAD family hydrolase [Oscillospiraceae bacterium]
MGYTTILFDMDGTLMNTLEDMADSVNAILRQLGHAER